MDYSSFLHWQIFFTGMWRLLLAQTWPLIAIAVLLAAAAFSTMIPVIGPWLTTVRLWLVAAAALIAIWFAGQTHGIILANTANKAKAEVVKKATDKAVTTSPLGDTTYSDPYDSPDN